MHGLMFPVDHHQGRGGLQRPLRNGQAVYLLIVATGKEVGALIKLSDLTNYMQNKISFRHRLKYHFCISS